MKAPGLGRLLLPLTIKAIVVNWTCAPGGTARYAGPDLLAADDRRTCLFSAVWRNASPGWPNKSQAESKDKRYSFMILIA